MQLFIFYALHERYADSTVIIDFHMTWEIYVIKSVFIIYALDYTSTSFALSSCNTHTRSKTFDR